MKSKFILNLRPFSVGICLFAAFVGVLPLSAASDNLDEGANLIKPFLVEETSNNHTDLKREILSDMEISDFRNAEKKIMEIIGNHNVLELIVQEIDFDTLINYVRSTRRILLADFFLFALWVEVEVKSNSYFKIPRLCQIYRVFYKKVINTKYSGSKLTKAKAIYFCERYLLPQIKELTAAAINRDILNQPDDDDNIPIISAAVLDISEETLYAAYEMAIQSVYSNVNIEQLLENTVYKHNFPGNLYAASRIFHNNQELALLLDENQALLLASHILYESKDFLDKSRFTEEKMENFLKLLPENVNQLINGKICLRSNRTGKYLHSRERNLAFENNTMQSELSSSKTSWRIVPSIPSTVFQIKDSRYDDGDDEGYIYMIDEYLSNVYVGKRTNGFSNMKLELEGNKLKIRSSEHTAQICINEDDKPKMAWWDHPKEFKDCVWIVEKC